MPHDFEIARTDLEVVRVGEDAQLESFEPPLLRTSIGEVEVNFAARHLALNALTALADPRVPSGSLSQRAWTSRSRSGGTRSCRCPAAASF